MNEIIDPDASIVELANALAIVATELATPSTGRVLAGEIRADRDSPAIDVSAMDGYAIRLNSLAKSSVAVVGECQPGQAPLTLQPDSTIRIFTGAAVPLGAEAIVMREDCDESNPKVVQWRERAKTVVAGTHIRFRGENGKADEPILLAGTMLTAAQIAAAANFGAQDAMLYRPVRASVIVTGNELLDPRDQPQPWQIRDSNGPTIAAVCQPHAWIHCGQPSRCGDDAELLAAQISNSLHQSDAVILTGGVSQGDYDHVPAVIASLGVRIVFHRLPIRPGRPILGAVSPSGQLILGLPGNPVSAAVGMRRFGIPLLAKQSGQRDWMPAPAQLCVDGPNEKTLPLHWFRLVRQVSASSAELLDSRGSGDLVAMSRSSGFIHQPPNCHGSGPWNYYPW